jgi:hypothetical protein
LGVGPSLSRRDGVPVLVEVKRATDTRARRLVIAQMLDYAANGIAYWPIQQIIDAYNLTVVKAGGQPEDVLRGFLGDSEPDSFWRQVEANLRSGRIRMVFVADRIHRELRRIIEFLNEQMSTAEVLGIEVAQFTAKGMRLLTPRLIGATERAVSVKAVTPAKPPIDEDEWLQTLRDQKGEVAAKNAGTLLSWFKEQGFTTSVTDSQDAISAGLARADGKLAWPFFIRRSTANVDTALQNLRYSPAYQSEEGRLALLDKLRKLPGMNITTVKPTGWPSVPLAALSNELVWSAFTSIVKEVQDRSSIR